MSLLERTGWRDQEISGRHREWGFNCPAVDLDFLLIEYNRGLPVAVVEYKHYLGRMPDLRHATYRAIAALADGYRDSPLPFVVAFYWPDTWAFRVYAVNGTADNFYGGPGPHDFSEREFVRSLYEIRSLAIQDRILARLHDCKPAPG